MRNKKATTTGRHAAGAERGEQLTEVNEAAEAVLTGESTRVVTHLAEQAFRGRPCGLPHLRNLSNAVPDQEEPATNQNGFSQAMAWMSEPDWNGESNEDMSETCAGSREPECGTD